MDLTTAGPDTGAARPTPAAGLTTGVSAAADLVAVLLFVVLGRRAHDEGSFLAGTAAVAWPFLAGAAVGWGLLLLLRGRPAPSSVRGGLVVLAATVPIGMALRQLAGRGVQPSFVLVATVFLTLFLVGHRLLVPVVRRWAGRRP